MTENESNLIAEKIKRVFRKDCNRVLLISPMLIPEEGFDIDIARSGRYTIFPPYGLGILCSNLDSRYYITEILDLDFEVLSHANQTNGPFRYNIWQDRVKESLQNFKPDLVGITCTFSITHRQLKMIADFVKRCNENMPVVAGGVHVSTATSMVLDDCRSIDFAFLYEADSSFADALDFANGKLQEDELTQIGTLINDAYVSIKKRSTPTELEINISPTYHNLRLEKYSSLGKLGAYSWLLPEHTRATHILSNRGCRGNCTFCTVRTVYGKGVRQRDVTVIVDEMEALKSKYGITHFVWLDDDLLFNEKRAIKLFNEITKRNLGITWDASNGVVAAAITPEIAHSAAESGCIGLSLGIESGNPDILRSMRKPSSIKNFRTAAQILKKHPQIFIRGFLMAGFPNETIGQIQDTINLALELSLDWYTVNIVIPFWSTEVRDEFAEIGGLNEETSIDELRYYSGDTGQQRLREVGEKSIARDFKDLFTQDLAHIPTKEELQDIWFLIEYRVNYERILSESNPIKLAMLEKMLRYICDRTYKGNAIGNLFLGIIERKLGNLPEAGKRMSLAREYAENSAFWNKRFEALNLYRLLKM